MSVETTQSVVVRYKSLGFDSQYDKNFLCNTMFRAARGSLARSQAVGP
jgi:hypothetical protein